MKEIDWYVLFGMTETVFDVVTQLIGQSACVYDKVEVVNALTGLVL